MSNLRAFGVLATALCAALPACASGWRLVGPETGLAHAVREPPPFRAVAVATMSTARGDLDAIAYLASPGAPRVRALLATESGLTILDVEVNGESERVHSQSELGSAPGLARSVAADLRRLLGGRSVFSVGAPVRALRVADDAAARVALPLPGGSWIVAAEDELRPGSPRLRVTLLDPSRVPEAEIVYEDPGPEGLPRTMRLRDLGDGHTLTLEVQQVTDAPAPGSP